VVRCLRQSMRKKITFMDPQIDAGSIDVTPPQTIATCCVCGMESSGAHKCSACGKEVHSICGTPEREGTAHWSNALTANEHLTLFKSTKKSRKTRKIKPKKCSKILQKRHQLSSFVTMFLFLFLLLIEANAIFKTSSQLSSK
jgi:hypothetical protein